MIMGSCTSPFYYGFMCEDSWFYGKLYLVQVYLCCLFALYATMREVSSFGSLWLNAIAFIVAGYSTVPGCLHLAWYMEKEQAHNFAIWPWLSGGVVYAIGAIIYAAKVPERFYQNKFDYVGSSHQIFHFFIMAAAALHLWGSFRTFHERQVYGCPENGKFLTLEDLF